MAAVGDALKNHPNLRIPKTERRKYGIMPSRGNYDGICPIGRDDSCPAGHQLTICPDKTDAYYCKQCSDQTFQPDENWLGDKCRLRVSCRKGHMFYIDKGSTTRDAVCGCFDGFYLPNNMDQRACFSNPICPPGQAPGKYGRCESCLEKGMYSDTTGPADKTCKPLTNCAKQGRCLEIESDGAFDNVCGPKISDSPCRRIETASSFSLVEKVFIGAGISGAVILFVFIVALIVFLLRRRKHSGRRDGGKVLKKTFTPDEMEELKHKIMKESERDPALCSKVISVSFSFIEERIGEQIWYLAQDMFRSHPVQGKYEVIVETYKDCQAKYTVNGYLQEWRGWRGDTRESVSDLFTSLRKVNRDDIVYEVCTYLRNNIDTFNDTECHTTMPVKHSVQDECMYVFFPCCYKPPKKVESPLPQSASTGQVVVEGDAGEAGTKLLAYPTDDLEGGDDDCGGDCEDEDMLKKPLPPPGTFYRDHPTPSAPPEDTEDMVEDTELESVKYSRQFSQPVQATS